jgi:hypothetical protein
VAADSCGVLGGFASGAASCAGAVGELDPVEVLEPSGDVASGAVGALTWGAACCAGAPGVPETSGDAASDALGGVGSGSCASALGELDPVEVLEPSGDAASGAVGALTWGAACCAGAVGRLDPPVRAAEPPEVLPRHSISLSVPC